MAAYTHSMHLLSFLSGLSGAESGYLFWCDAFLPSVWGLRVQIRLLLHASFVRQVSTIHLS